MANQEVSELYVLAGGIPYAWSLPNHLAYIVSATKPHRQVHVVREIFSFASYHRKVYVNPVLILVYDESYYCWSLGSLL